MGQLPPNESEPTTYAEMMQLPANFKTDLYQHWKDTITTYGPAATVWRYIRFHDAYNWKPRNPREAELRQQCLTSLDLADEARIASETAAATADVTRRLLEAYHRQVDPAQLRTVAETRSYEIRQYLRHHVEEIMQSHGVLAPLSTTLNEAGERVPKPEHLLAMEKQVYYLQHRRAALLAWLADFSRRSEAEQNQLLHGNLPDHR
jgi:hypothetical protein